MTNPKGFRNNFQVEDEERKKQKTYLKQREFSQINVKHKTIDTGISVITKQNKCKKLYAVISFSNLRKSKEKNLKEFGGGVQWRNTGTLFIEKQRKACIPHILRNHVSKKSIK